MMVPIKRILCPVDFFPASERAVDYAIALAKTYEGKLILLHVVSPVLPSAYEIALNTEEIITALTESAREQLNTIAKRAQIRKVPVQVFVRVGDVDLEIHDLAKSEKADLIVMGTHGRRGFERWFMGSVTEGLLRRSTVPLMTIGGTIAKATYPMMRRILITTDFSDGTSDAIRYAFSIAQECQSRVTLLHVVSDINGEVSGKYREPLIHSIQMKIESLVPKEARDWCEVSTRVETRLPSRKILEILRKEKFDLIVMNIHGKGMLDRALLGSTAERVVRGATAPVLVIPPIKVARPKKRQPKSKK